MFLGVMLAAAFAVGAPQIASADIAAPVIVPAPDSLGGPNATSSPACRQIALPSRTTRWRTCLLPDHDAVVDWPDQPSERLARRRGRSSSPSRACSRPGSARARTEIGRPLIWYDVGSGMPLVAPSIGYEFPLAGKYAWECLVCSASSGTKLQGTMYVIGPRADHHLQAALRRQLAERNITYGFDASGSFVTDYTPHSIVEYAFDFQDDGIYDQDDARRPDRRGDVHARARTRCASASRTTSAARPTYPFVFEVPYVRPAEPDPGAVDGHRRLGNINSGVAFPKTKIKVKASKKIKVKVLRSRGPEHQDQRTDQGRPDQGPPAQGQEVRRRLGQRHDQQQRRRPCGCASARAGKRILKAKPRVKRLVLDVADRGHRRIHDDEARRRPRQQCAHRPSSPTDAHVRRARWPVWPPASLRAQRSCRGWCRVGAPDDAFASEPAGAAVMAMRAGRR